MAIVIKFQGGRKEVWHVVATEDLPQAVKRALTMQVMEFIHELEDTESGPETSNVRFLESCLKAA